MDASFDVALRGDGVVARTLALALARLGLKLALPMTERPAADDIRAYALNAASIALLKQLGVWDALADDARTAVYDMYVDGDARNASLHFSAWSARVGELAWIVDAGALLEALAQAVRHAERIAVTDDAVPATLIALAEGRASTSRDALGVAFELREYRQQAIAARLVAARDHQGIARQWFGAPDVLALLPLDRPEPRRSYALVWSLPDDRAQTLLAADARAFETALHDASSGAVGALALRSDRRAWPLAMARASRVCGDGWVLLGDAAHVVHPLAGQGLNLGLADVAALTRTIAAREPWRSLGDARLLRRYARERALPTQAMGFVTDALQRLFAAEAAPVQELRNRGLTLVNHLPPVKRWLISRALDS